jgi:hypothetical protein
MTAQVTPPGRQSHWFRNISIGVIVLMVLLAALGSAANRQTANVAAPEPSAGPASSDVAFPDDSPSPPPSGATLLSIKGTGPKTSDDFQAGGDSVDVKYDYTCAAADSFSLDFYGANQSPLLPDNLVSSDQGQSDASITTENLNGMTGPFHIEIDTACEWSVEVIGEP